jgi:hypothetical protein
MIATVTGLDYLDYYHRTRIHLSLDKDCLDPSAHDVRSVRAPSSARGSSCFTPEGFCRGPFRSAFGGHDVRARRRQRKWECPRVTSAATAKSTRNHDSAIVEWETKDFSCLDLIAVS